jgi:hypothetical protein
MDGVQRIEYWYDRSLRLWTILKKDQDGNQIGCAEYAPNSGDLIQVMLKLQQEYPNAEVKKG